MMFTLKVLLEYQGKLANWKVNELKEKESHESLERGLNDLVNSGVLLVADKADFDYVKAQRLPVLFATHPGEESLEMAKNLCTADSAAREIRKNGMGALVKCMREHLE